MAGSPSRAAQLGMSPSAVSHAIRTVEDGLGLPLFARTTRSVSLTEAGADFMASVGPALAGATRPPGVISVLASVAGAVWFAVVSR